MVAVTKRVDSKLPAAARFIIDRAGITVFKREQARTNGKYSNSIYWYLRRSSDGAVIRVRRSDHMTQSTRGYSNGSIPDDPPDSKVSFTDNGDHSYPAMLLAKWAGWSDAEIQKALQVVKKRGWDINTRKGSRLFASSLNGDPGC